ncbi:hypothetical protein [Streptomyces sp. NBC_01262]|uniref:hypothetical protein n=1 Tax=Streptomyces sp. NBC_01262 TaxID=2903803 RepID=UPI002E3657CA|nr:hypothetical protein [Streptomyces sp. NBC_01262]
MSKQDVQLEPENGGEVRWLAVAAAGRVQTAYRAFLEHGQACSECAALEARCPEAETLWVAYRGERR